MRLLHTSTLCFAEFLGENIPPYAILSHTWEVGEVSYHEFLQGRRSEKIRRCCEIAASESWDYVWIDTCCIDKSSSAELSEAINSMYQWYQDAEVCYAYMVDIPTLRDYQRVDELFVKSKWFTRGWTLQELLAPRRVVFFNVDWNKIGSKQSKSFFVSKATGIESFALQQPINASIAAKMSWMSHRRTTRVEDMAYCLLGLFQVNMPLLYGEGSKAFTRLQEEIIKISDDQSIFAWVDKGLENSGMFARHPSAFATSGEIVPTHELPYFHKQPYRMTNQGLEIEVPVYEGCFELEDGCSSAVNEDVVLWRGEVPLACERTMDSNNLLFVSLSFHKSGETTRVNCYTMTTLRRSNLKLVESRRFIVATKSSLVNASGTKQLWDTTNICMRESAQAYFSFVTDYSGPIFLEPPTILSFSTRIDRWSKIGFVHGLDLANKSRVVSIRSDNIQGRALVLWSHANEGFMIYWSQHPNASMSPTVNVLRAYSGQFSDRPDQFRYFQHSQNTELHLEQLDFYASDLGESGISNVQISLRDEKCNGIRRLVIDIDVKYPGFGNEAPRLASEHFQDVTVGTQDIEETQGV